MRTAERGILRTGVSTFIRRTWRSMHIMWHANFVSIAGVHSCWDWHRASSLCQLTDSCNRLLYSVPAARCHAEPFVADASIVIGVGAQSTLGAGHFAWKYMYENITKCSNFTWYLPEKYLFPEFWGADASLPRCTVYYAYVDSGWSSRRACVGGPETHVSMSSFTERVKFWQLRSLPAELSSFLSSSSLSAAAAAAVATTARTTVLLHRGLLLTVLRRYRDSSILSEQNG